MPLVPEMEFLFNEDWGGGAPPTTRIYITTRVYMPLSVALLIMIGLLSG